MPTPQNHILSIPRYGRITLAGLTLLWCSLVGVGQEVVSTGHYDLFMDFDPQSKTWTSGIFDFDRAEVLDPEARVFQVGEEGRRTIPEGAPWHLMGEPGQPVWVFPEVFDSGRVYLGVGTQWMGRGIFTGGFSNRGRISMALVGIEGSGVDAGGSLTMWQAGFPPRVHFATGDGIGPEDVLADIPAGAHSHYNWAFSKPGDYRVTFEVSGELVAALGGGITQTQVTYHFRVVDSPANSIFAGAETVAGWHFLPWLGYFIDNYQPWIFHAEHGWWFVDGDNGESAFVWDSQLGWLWLNRHFYPFLFRFETGTWLTFETTAEDGSRWFFDQAEGWLAVPRS